MTGPTMALHLPAIQTTTFHLDPHTQDPQRRGALSFPPTLTPATTVAVILGLTPPPPRYRLFQIVCNDCNRESSDVAFHVLALKCSHCGSYNTRRT